MAPRSSSILLHSSPPVDLRSGHDGAATCEAVGVLCIFFFFSGVVLRAWHAVDLVLLQHF